jgi:hypothetical protein
MLILTKESLPRWYGLSWNSEERALVLSIHKDFLPKCRLRRDWVEPLKEEFGFSSFDSSFESGFGFDGALRFQEEKEGFKKFSIPLPAIRKETSKKCVYCNGKGRNKHLGGKCLSCDGRGKEVIYEHKPGFAISVSLTLFSWGARFLEEKTSASLPQLFTVETSTKRGMHGGELSGMFGLEFSSYLRRQRLHQNLDFATEAMFLAHNRMINRSLYERRHFPVYVSGKEGQIHISCPGDGCSIYCDNSFTTDREGGQKFYSHNTDSPHQQLTLLAGLAALHDRVDEELKIKK